MAELTIKTRDGVSHNVKGREGVSLMEIIRDNGFEELVAMCGGCLSCATCHIYITDLPKSAVLSEMGIDEEDLLDGSDFRKPGSRLSCQISYDSTLAGITVEIAPED